MQILNAQCGKEFQTLYRLNRHMQTHSTVREYVCSVCNRGFAQRDYLNVHMVSNIYMPEAGLYLFLTEASGDLTCDDIWLLFHYYCKHRFILISAYHIYLTSVLLNSIL